MAFTATILTTLYFLLTAAAGLMGIGIIIGFHELGHFLACKIFHIRTPSFSIGFGPVLFKKKIGDTDFTLSAIPAGGYVEIAGSAEVGQGEQKDAYSTDEGSFAKKPWYQKMLVMFGGIAFNILFAYIALSILFMTSGSQSPLLFQFNLTNRIATVVPDSAAAKAGLRVDDMIEKIEFRSTDPNIPSKIIAIKGYNSETYKVIEQFLQVIRENPNNTIIMHVIRPGPNLIGDYERPLGEIPSARIEIPVTLGSKEVMGNTIGSLGVEFARDTGYASGFFDAIKRGVQLTNLHIVATYQAFRYIFTKRDTSEVGGPIMIISATAQAFSKGFGFFLLLLAIISINLAVLNLIPLPIFDGGQMLYYTIEAIIRRPLPIKVREYIHIANWILVIILMAYLSFKDVARMVKPHISKITQAFKTK